MLIFTNVSERSEGVVQNTKINDIYVIEYQIMPHNIKRLKWLLLLFF